MNINLGEQFEEARKKNGITLREAADATKIRKDYLDSFENNKFDIPLPEIYIRGFLRLYAKYLRLDVNQVMMDYKTLVFGKSGNRRDNKEIFGRMDLIDKEKLLVLNKETDGFEQSKHSSDRIENSVNKTLLWKIGLVTSSCITLIALVAFFFSNSMHSKNAENINSSPFAATASEDSNLYLVGTGDVQVFMRQEKDKARVFAGTIHKGERKSLSRQGPVQISFSEGANLMIEKPNGDQIRPKTQGHGWIKVL